MSTDDLKGLLDDMLGDSTEKMQARDEEDAEARRIAMQEAEALATKRRAREAEEAKKKAAEEAALEAAKIADVEELAGFGDQDVRQVLAKVIPNDLLVVLACGSAALSRKLLANLSPDSVQWMRQNLEYFDEPTKNLRESAQRGVLDRANVLILDGTIHKPAAADPEGGEKKGSGETDPFLALLVDLVTVAKKTGPEALAGLSGDIEDPLLAQGLGLLAKGVDTDDLEASVTARREALEAAFRRRNGAIVEALLAIRRGEGPEAFAKRIA